MGTKSAKLRLITMRFLYSFLLACMLVLAVGCSAPAEKATPVTNPPVSMVAARTDAVNIALHILDTEGTRWLEPPRAALVEQMSYAHAHELIPMLSDPRDTNQNPETQLWLVIFQGRWRLLPYGQTQGEPTPTVYEGCGFVLIAAATGDLVAMGDTLCPR